MNQSIRMKGYVNTQPVKFETSPESQLRNKHLRAVTCANKSKTQPLHQRVASCFRNLATAIIALPTPGMKNSMCTYYGHVIDEKNWNSGLPKCDDCGKQVNGIEDLRKSSTKPSAK
jgi:hypothetical protein